MPYIYLTIYSVVIALILLSLQLSTEKKATSSRIIVFFLLFHQDYRRRWNELLDIA